MSSVKHWILATRPRTLTASISPVIIACALAYANGVFRLIPAILCALVAELSQMGSNLANDYYDHKKGDDKVRLGQARAISSGWVTAKAMRKAFRGVLVLDLILGISLAYYGGWWIIGLAVVVVLCALAYSTGPLPVSRNGLGDAFVVIFYGIVPATFSYYVQAGYFSLECFLLSFIPGLLSTNILIVNNYRDHVQDRENGKFTTVVIFGRRIARMAYFFNCAVALGMAIYVLPLTVWSVAVYIIFAILFLVGFLMLVKRDGRALNFVLEYTANNVIFYSIALSLIILFA